MCLKFAQVVLNVTIIQQQKTINILCDAKIIWIVVKPKPPHRFHFTLKPDEK